MNRILNADTEVILLLCGVFGRGSDPKPLSILEYSQFAQWLIQQGLRPADLLQVEGIAQLSSFHHKKITTTRLHALLQRTGALAFAIEQWTNKGLWIISRSDKAYPRRLKEKLKQLAPPILYGAGNVNLLAHAGLGIVGSRNVDENGLEFTRSVTRLCVKQSIQIVSGGAKGVDSEAMLSALAEGGTVIGVLGHGLAKASLSKKYRQALRDKNLVLVSPYYPDASFNVGFAMGRNKYIYTLSDACLVVASDVKGGTWTGAIENIDKKWVPLLVRDALGVPEGNKQLIDRGGIAVTSQTFEAQKDIRAWLCNQPLPSATEKMIQPPLLLQEQLFNENVGLSDKMERISFADNAASNRTVGKPDATDLFDVVWPYLAPELKKPKTVEQLAEKFTLHPAQVESWLEKARARGMVRQRHNPTRYQRTADFFAE